ncbi:MAG: hypothetical protein AB7S42_12470 [Lysobacteraceae bacterium]
MSSTTADIRDYLAKQMRELAGLSDLDPANENDRAKLAAAVEIAKASAGVAAQFTQVVKAEIDAARAMSEFGVTTGSVSLEDGRKQIGGRG